MSTKTKKVTSVFFIFLLFTPFLFTLFVSVLKEKARERMHEALEKQNLQTIVVPQDEVKWMDEKEIWINDMLFDIHSCELVNDMYIFTGLFDKTETLLVEIEKEANKKNNQQDEWLNLLFKDMPLVCIYQNDEYNPLLHQYILSFTVSPPLHPFREILTPPPQC